MDSNRKPHVLLGALAGLLLTPVFMALMYLGEVFAGLPFVPFDLFDRIARLLPGGLVTFGIDTMVSVLIALGLGGDLSSNAKMAERLIALGIYIGLSVVVAAVFSGVMNRLKNVSRESYVPGIIAGLIFGLPLTGISFGVNVSATAEPLLRLVWLLVLYAGWGAGIGYVYNALAAVKLKRYSDGTVEPAVETIDRRQFLIRFGGATATLTVLGAGLGAYLNNMLYSSTPVPTASPDGLALKDGSGNPLPNASDPLLPAPGTRLEYTPVDKHYRIDIVAGALPEFDAATYKLPITGSVENPVEWTLDEIYAMPRTEAFITLSCISNPIAGSLISTTKWTGVSWQYLLEQIKPTAKAVALKISSADGFDEYLALDLIRQDERVMLVYAFDDKPLPQRNGFPLRTHIPSRYGMKQPKWINKIEVVDEMGEGYWVRRGWSRDAIVRATSVIDTVATEAIYQERGQYMIPIGGIAWAGARGIARVEIRMDGGDWQAAQLRSPMSERTWVLWRYDWAFTDGAHTFEVRCVEKDGTLQIEDRAGVRPDGATGLHTKDEILSYPA